MYKIGLLKQDKKIDIELLDEYSDDFIEYTNDSLNDVSEIYESFRSFVAVAKVYEEYSGFVREFTLNEIHIGEFCYWIDYKINNLLSTSYKYLENIKTKFNRDYCKKTIDYYKSCLSELYDNSFSYRLIYNLRNYCQHCGNPVHNTRQMNNKIIIELDRKIFIDEHKNMQLKFRSELLEIYEDEFNLDFHLTQYFLELSKLNDKFTRYIIELDFEKNLYKMLHIIDNFYSENLKYIIIKNYNKYKELGEEINFNFIKVSSCRQLLSLYCLEFKGNADIILNLENDLPKLKQNNDTAEMQTISIGNDIVMIRKSWYELKLKKIPKSNGFFYSVYVNNDLLCELKSKIEVIFKRRLLKFKNTEIDNSEFDINWHF